VRLEFYPEGEVEAPWLKFLKLPITYTTEQYHLIFLATKETPEATIINCKIIPFIMTYESIFFCTHCKYLEQLA